MNRIEKYVDDIVAGLPINDAEQQDVKEEITQHLFEHIDELMIKGYTKDEAISYAIQSFGNETMIQKEMKKVLFPYYKFIRFFASVVAVATLLCITSNLLTKLYFPKNDPAITVELFLVMLMICFVSLGLAEMLYEGIVREYQYKWITNPWSFFLLPAILLEIVLVSHYLLNAGPDEIWIFNDYLFIPLYPIFYVISRQLFTWLFVKKQTEKNVKLPSV